MFDIEVIIKKKIPYGSRKKVLFLVARLPLVHSIHVYIWLKEPLYKKAMTILEKTPQKKKVNKRQKQASEIIQNILYNLSTYEYDKYTWCPNICWFGIRTKFYQHNLTHKFVLFGYSHFALTVIKLILKLIHIVESAECWYRPKDDIYSWFRLAWICHARFTMLILN